ncbi:MAG: glycoside hydrolase family 16 protein, partial [Alphaproteobacteria bacterium]|nr:glycoside hydrolase family 16 protein [Alphaproteobacteria bacterium]
MIRSKALLLAAAMSVLAAGCGDPLPPVASMPSAGERLVFADEFDAPTLDRSKWNVIGPDFWVNEEEQAYIDSPETIRFAPAGSAAGAEDGVLILQPVFREGFEMPIGREADFVSGRITTEGRYDFTHGRAVARIRMPDAVGVWPAFWLLGNGTWPETGEIDIMEYVGEADWVINTALGTLTLAADGSYSYAANPNVVTGTATDSFVYTIRDADGDTSTTTLTITINDSGLAAGSDNVIVNEAGLPIGSTPAAATEIATGT